MDQHGIDVRDHRSHNLTEEDIHEADLILVMTRGHQEAIAAEFPEARDKMYLLSELVNGPYDITDPYSGSLTVYRYCAQEIGEIVEDGYERLLELADTGQETPTDVS